MGLTKLFTLCCLTWALFGEVSAAANLTKNLDLDSLISNMFGNQGSSYPGNAQSYPTGVQNNPQYPSNGNNMNPGNNYQRYPSNAYQGRNPQYQRPGNGFNNVDPRYNYQGRPSSQGRYPQYPGSDNGIYNNYPGNNYPANAYPGYYQGRPNQINDPQGNVWNNANEIPGINYPGGFQFFPGSSSQGSPQYQRPGDGFSGYPSNGLPSNYRPNPGMGGNWNDVNGNPGFNYDPSGFYPNSGQRRPGTNWNNLNGYPNNQNPNQITVPGNQIQTQGVGSQGFDQQNPGLVQGQPIQFPQGHTYRPGLQNGGVFNPSQGSNGLNNQLPNSQNQPNFKPTYPDQNGHLHKHGLNLNPTEKDSVLENPAVISSHAINKR